MTFGGFGAGEWLCGNHKSLKEQKDDEDRVLLGKAGLGVRKCKPKGGQGTLFYICFALCPVFLGLRELSRIHKTHSISHRC